MGVVFVHIGPLRLGVYRGFTTLLYIETRKLTLAVH